MGNYQLASAEGNLKSFNKGAPLMDMGAYVGFANTKDWAPGAKRTYYFYSYFAQGANPSTQARTGWLASVRPGPPGSANAASSPCALSPAPC